MEFPAPVPVIEGRRSLFARTLQGYISANIYFSKLCAIIVICSSSKRKYLGGRGEHFIFPFPFWLAFYLDVN